MFSLMIVVFVFGYAAIVMEHNIKINKAASALLTGTILWSILALGGNDIMGLGYSLSFQDWLSISPDGNTPEGILDFITHHSLFEHLSEIASILFFLLGAMTIVEIVDRFQGFRVITDRIKTRDLTKLLWGISFLTFFMSALLDNLTTTIVMITLLRKILADKKSRMYFTGMVVIAANAGGAWSPIGDITTIMLWIGGQVTTLNIIGSVFLPSLVAVVIPLTIASFKMKGQSIKPHINANESREFTSKSERQFIFIFGVAALLMVPIFKTVTHLPPFLGMLLGLGLIWTATEFMLMKEEREDRRKLNVVHIMEKLDNPTILFFLGILMAVGALQTAGHLDLLAGELNVSIGNIYFIDFIIGILSSIVDNVPLVAGAMGMYDIAEPGTLGFAADFVQNGHFWSFLAFCAGTGGSVLIVGSAAGVAAMGMEKISFGWYLKNIGWLALLGYIGGSIVYYLQFTIF